jgi:WD40 repeat protein
MAVDFKYRAFISYSHADHKSAVWLHKALEKYPIHKKLVGLQTPAGKTSRRLGRVFRDEAEIGAVPELGPKIEAALQSSDTLIVLCSPNSAQSEWVAKEITRFKELGRQNRVLALILDGEPNALDPAEECFPEPLKRNPDGTHVQPLAVDIRKFGRDDALVRLVSGILDIEYDQLKQRDVQRRRAEMRRAQALFAAGLVLLISALGAGFLALRGFADLAHAKSDTLAREAKIIFDNGEGDKAKSLLMALQADPAANRSLIRQVFSGGKGYPLAQARLVSAHASRQLERILPAHQTAADGLAFAPDGRSFVTSSWDRTAKIWDASTGELLQSVRGGEEFGVAAAYSHDGTSIYIAEKFRVQQWDLATNQLIPFETSHTAIIVDLAISRDGRFLATASWDGTAKIWDLSTRQVVNSVVADENIFASVAFSPDSRTLATGSGDIGKGETKLWDVATGTLQQTFSGQAETIYALAWSSDGKYLASASGDNTVKAWDVSGGFELYTLRAHQDMVRGLAFSPDGALLVTASADKTIRLSSALTGHPVAVLSGHRAGLSRLAFAPDGQRFVSTSAEGVVRIWKARAGDQATRLRLPESDMNLGPIETISYSTDGTQILVGHGHEHALLWNAETGALTNTFGIPGESIYATAFSPDGTRIATGMSDRTIRIWNKQTGDLVQALMGHDAHITSLSYSPDGTTLISGDLGGYAFLWDMSTGRMQSIIETGIYAIDELRFASDGQTFTVLNNAGEAYHWDLATAKQISRFGEQADHIEALQFSPDQQSVLTGTGSGQLKEWDVATQALRTTYTTNGASIYAAAFAQNGDLAIAGSGNNYGGWIEVFDTHTGERLIKLFSSTMPIDRLVVAPDTKSVLFNNPLGGDDRTVAEIWRLPEIIHATPGEQVRMACETLWAMNAPLHFTQADAQAHPVLTGEPVDPETGDFVSPCLGILPDEAFAR